MPRFIVEQAFFSDMDLPTHEKGDHLFRKIISNNAEKGVTWVKSYVGRDRTRAFFVYDAPGPDEILQAGERNRLPIDDITEVSVLDPYFYLGIGESGRKTVPPSHLRTPWLPFSYLIA
jgi:hypothetical protein